LRVPRSTMHAPMVQTVCSFEQLDLEPPTFAPRIRSARTPVPCTAAKLELSLGVEVHAAGVLTDWEDRTALFNESTMAALGRAKLAVLAAFLDDIDGPMQRLKTYNLPSVLVGPSEPATVAIPADVAVPHRISAQAAATPEAIAVRTGMITLT